MTSLFYTTGGSGVQKRYYAIKKNKNIKNKNKGSRGIVNRITCQEYDDQTKNKKLGKTKPRIGSEVVIIIKPYHNYDCRTGIVSRILTNKQIHTRGHKVILRNGLIGRTLKIIKL